MTMKDINQAGRSGDEFEVLRRVSGPSLAERVRAQSPRWNSLMTAAEKHHITPGMVYGAVLDGGAARLSSDPKFPYQRVALIVDRATIRDNGEREYIIEEYEDLVRQYSYLEPADPAYSNAQEALRLLRDVVYPDYFQEQSVG